MLDEVPPMKLLPSFCNVATPGAWGVGAAQVDLDAMKEGRPVSSALYKALALWVIEKAYLGLFAPRKDDATLQFHSEVPQGPGCMVIAHQCCSRADLRWSQAYVHVAIGKNEEGVEVLEGLHRLVCWARYGPPPVQGDVAMHVGPQLIGINMCRGGKKCVHPGHVEWRSQAYNARDYANKRGYQKERRPPL
jgi:hypothetical protein